MSEGEQKRHERPKSPHTHPFLTVLGIIGAIIGILALFFAGKLFVMKG